MSQKELAKVLNGETIKDSGVWAHCKTTSKGISFLADIEVVSKECRWNMPLKTTRCLGRDVTPDDVWDCGHDEKKESVVEFAYYFDIANVSMDYLVEFEVDDSIYNERVKNCYGQYFDTLLKELYIPEEYSLKELTPVRVVDNMRFTTHFECDDYLEEGFSKEDMNWIDIKGLTYHDIKKIRTSNMKARYASRRDLINSEKELNWEDEMEFLYS